MKFSILPSFTIKIRLFILNGHLDHMDSPAIHGLFCVWLYLDMVQFECRPKLFGKIDTFIWTHPKGPTRNT